MPEEKQKIDSDILKCKQDILRAKKLSHPKPPADKSVPAEPSPLMAAVVQANKAGSERKDESVPSFNVANRILSDQRKASSEKRKSPVIKSAVFETASVVKPSEPSAESTFARREIIESFDNSPSSAKNKQSIPKSFISIPPNQSTRTAIIAQIVARDIDKLCKNRAITI
ncbi:MAG: hypothetical protein WCZ89_04570 [Phycisphaerae bacterium]